jgi:prepilin peptidase CpaA
MIKWLYFAILIELAIVSWIDIKTKKISNLWAVVNLSLALGLYVFYPDFFPLEWELLVFPVGFTVVGFFLFLLKVMGAGDSKYLASLFLVIPLEYQTVMFEKIIYSTFVVGFIMLVMKIIKDFKIIKVYAFSQYWKGMRESVRSKFSYAPVIFLAWLLLGAREWL